MRDWSGFQNHFTVLIPCGTQVLVSLPCVLELLQTFWCSWSVLCASSCGSLRILCLKVAVTTEQSCRPLSDGVTSCFVVSGFFSKKKKQTTNCSPWLFNVLRLLWMVWGRKIIHYRCSRLPSILNCFKNKSNEIIQCLYQAFCKSVTM